MTIWILAVLLLASLAGLGYRQGAIRVAFSFAGIVLGALLAPPLAGLLKPLLRVMSIKNSLLLWVLPVCILFLVVLAVFKAAGLFAHKKAEVYYKYKTGELRLALWERLNQRLGLCLGLLNGAAYLVLVALVIYMMSYWTYQTQTAASESDPRTLRIVNRLGKDLEITRLSKVARAVDQMPAAFYDAADIAGLIYQNPQVEARFSRYPAFLDVAERPELQGAANDAGFMDLRRKNASTMELLNHPKAQAILNNPALVRSISDALVPNLADFTNFLTTGRSEKFDAEKFLGRWRFDTNGAVALVRKARPTLTPTQVASIRNGLAARFGRATFIATPEKQAFLKYVPQAGAAPSTEPQTMSGQWNKTDSKYDLTLTVDGRTEQLTAEFEGSRLVITGAGLELAFYREI